ncbi:MAG: hypothetical protein HY820_03885 [Acidobacteria bacterium]|nr:hypothetical protein [Acidobacteriota bacterium]
MATDKQIEANRLNSDKSTGPRTEAGKQKSSQNSLRHGLAAQGFLVAEDQQDKFTRLQDGLRVFLNPHGPVQMLLFTQVLASAWNLERCNLAQADLFLESGIDPFLDDKNEPKYDRINKYHKQYEASLYRAMRELGSLQTEVAYRKRAFPITREQRNDEDYFSSTPHAESDLCRFHKVIDMVNRHSRVRNEANSAAQSAVQNEANSAPPPAETAVQNEANSTPPSAESAVQNEANSAPPPAETTVQNEANSAPPPAETAVQNEANSTPTPAESAVQNEANSAPPPAETAGQNEANSTPPSAETAVRNEANSAPPSAESAVQNEANSPGQIDPETSLPHCASGPKTRILEHVDFGLTRQPPGSGRVQPTSNHMEAL